MFEISNTRTRSFKLNNKSIVVYCKTRLNLLRTQQQRSFFLSINSFLYKCFVYLFTTVANIHLFYNNTVSFDFRAIRSLSVSIILSDQRIFACYVMLSSVHSTRKSLNKVYLTPEILSVSFVHLFCINKTAQTYFYEFHFLYMSF